MLLKTKLNTNIKCSEFSGIVNLTIQRKKAETKTKTGKKRSEMQSEFSRLFIRPTFYSVF